MSLQRRTGVVLLGSNIMYDVIIVGGGPGGSTAGSILAKGGKRVLILEREKFPRFHIGESLIPFGNDVFREIGVWDKMKEAGFMPKLGAEFVLGNGRAKIEVLFARYLLARYGQTFQVERAKFDQLLLENAQEAGCEVWQEAKVASACEEAEQMVVTCQHGGETKTLTARYVVDASGRDAFLGKQFKLEKTDLGLPKKFATFAHFTGVVRNPPPADGHISIVRLEFGWFWIIPLDKEKTSVGLVQTMEHFKKTGNRARFLQTALYSEEYAGKDAEGADMNIWLVPATDVMLPPNEFAMVGFLNIGYLQLGGVTYLMHKFTSSLFDVEVTRIQDGEYSFDPTGYTPFTLGI